MEVKYLVTGPTVLNISKSMLSVVEESRSSTNTLADVQCAMLKFIMLLTAEAMVGRSEIVCDQHCSVRCHISSEIALLVCFDGRLGRTPSMTASTTEISFSSSANGGFPA